MNKRDLQPARDARSLGAGGLAAARGGRSGAVALLAWLAGAGVLLAGTVHAGFEKSLGGILANFWPFALVTLVLWSGAVYPEIRSRAQRRLRLFGWAVTIALSLLLALALGLAAAALVPDSVGALGETAVLLVVWFSGAWLLIRWVLRRL